MNKQLKEMLKGAKIQVKWRNCGTWQNEDLENLLDCVNQYRIKIRKIKINGNNYYRIKMSVGSLKIEETAYFENDLERKLYNFINYRCVYLGDKARIKTSFGVNNINN